MFEFDKYEASLHSKPLVPMHQYTPFDNASHISYLIWSEHCIECAAPDCFATCDLYQSRPDQRCRRFQFGIFKNRSFDSMRGYGAELTFKKWAQLKAQGNVRMESVRAIKRKEKLLECTSPLINLASSLMNRLTGDIRWNYRNPRLLEEISRYLHRRARISRQPDAFVLEVYNPANTTAKLHLRMLPARYLLKGAAEYGSIPVPFLETVTLSTGHSRHVFERDRFETITKSGIPFDITITPEAEGTSSIVILTADFVIRKRKEKECGLREGPPNVKCIVWDLDGTIWDGTLIEQDNVTLRPGIVETINSLDRRGILNSVASKNDFDHAMQKLTDFGLADYMVHPQINWGPKSESLSIIAERLNLGLDAFAFIDDNPFERAEVAARLPAVTCIDSSQSVRLIDDPRFSGSTSADAKNRRAYYQNEMRREERRTELGSDYLQFLRSCEMRLEIGRVTSENFDRVAELVQRTNQLNFSGKHYSREELSGLLLKPDIQTYVLKACDKYGDYGTVGLGIVRHSADEILIDDFMLSCRVQGKFIEQAFFNYLVETCGSPSLQVISIQFRPTKRNTPARQVLESLGFERIDSEERMQLILQGTELDPGFIDVVTTVAE